MKKVRIFTSLTLLFLTLNCAGKPYYEGAKSDNFDGEKFISENDESVWDHIRFLFSFKDPWEEDEDEIVKTPNVNKDVARARVTFIGHSTFLIQLPEEISILTDPIWSDRAGPIAMPFVSPKRHNAVPLDLEDLPKINYVLISYSSYYHMDLPTIKRLKKLYNPIFITGLGNCHYLNVVKKIGVQCIQLDWEQKTTLKNGVDFYFLKARNWSQRSWFDENKTLWGSFAIMTPNFKLYFAGDSGYSKHLNEINKKYGAFDVALLPIGSYKPKWMMHYNHMSPDDAVRAHVTLQAKKSIGMHFNTFQTTNEGYFDTKLDLIAARKSQGVSPQDFVMPKFGESFEF